MAKSLLRRTPAVVGLLAIVLIVLSALLAAKIARYDPTEQTLADRLAPPSADHWFGTDSLGRDIFSRIVWGARISLTVSALAVFLGAGSGSLLGLAAGYVGRTTDNLLMRVTDIMMAFPTLLLALFIVAVLGQGFVNMILAIGIASIPQFARFMRAEALRVTLLDYVEAARALGASHPRILFRHVLPNTLSSLIILMSLRASVAILAEASLGFLGLGVPPPTPSWGTMVNDGRPFLTIAPWASLVPGVVIAVTVLALNLIGDGLRDALDPRLRGEGT